MHHHFIGRTRAALLLPLLIAAALLVGCGGNDTAGSTETTGT